MNLGTVPLFICLTALSRAAKTWYVSIRWC